MKRRALFCVHTTIVAIMAKQIPGLCQEIIREPAPVVMVDTCAVLDIIRTPIRDKIPSDVVLAARELVERAQRQPRALWVIATETVVKEWEDHRLGTAEEVRKELRVIDRKIELLHAAAKHLDPVRFAVRPEFGTIGLNATLLSLAQDLVDVAEILSIDDAADLRAGRRVRTGQPPSSKGKSEYKDCLIFEHYLELSGCLRDSGFQEERFLVTSNVTDYGNPSSADNPLAGELAAAGLRYVTDLWWLRNSL